LCPAVVDQFANIAVDLRGRRLDSSGLRLSTRLPGAESAGATDQV
jgi:hypothetical protein